MPRCTEPFVQWFEVGLVESIDVGVGGDRDPCLAQPGERLRCGTKAAACGAHQVVGGFETVHADRDAVDPRIADAASQCLVDAACAGRHGRTHASRRDGPHDGEKARMQVGLAANQRDLPGAHGRQLIDDARLLPC